MATDPVEADATTITGGGSSVNTDGAKGPRWRRILAWVLVVVACVLAILSAVTVFARNQLLNTDAYVKTVAPLASNPAIQTQIAKQVSTNLIKRGDVESRVKDALPPKAGFLAAPITSGLETLTNQLALKTVQSKQFYDLWVTVNRSSHKQLVAVLTGSSEGTVSSSNGRVTIDLTQVEVNLKEKLDAKGITVFDKVPAAKGLNFVLFQSKNLVKIQKLTKLLNDLAIVLPIIALLCFAASVVLARNRRRGVVRAAIGLALSMAVVLVVVAVGRNQYLSGLSPSQSVAANQAVIDTVTANLRLGLRIILAVSAVIAVVAALAGNRRFRAWVSRDDRPDNPVHQFVADHRKGLQWGALGLALLVLVVWSEPTTLVAIVVVAIALVLIGAVGVYGANRHVMSPSGPPGTVPAHGDGSSGPEVH
jgi:multisubunit Na+/H+ antiporter MnhF subunit